MAVIFEFRYIYSEFRSSKLRFPLIFFFFQIVLIHLHSIMGLMTEESSQEFMVQFSWWPVI